VAIFEWKSEYDTGIAEIDNQHMVLVSLINELHELVNDNFDRSLAEQIFAKLRNYAVFHFATEEGLMTQYHYTASDLDAHLSQHRQFEGEFESLQADFANISLDECNIVLSYLTNWLTNHICKVDRRLAEHIYAQRQAENHNIVSYSSESVVVVSAIHIKASDEMVEQLEACIEDLKCQCDVMVQSASDSNFGDMSAAAYSSCSQGLNLVKSLKSSQRRLKELLDQVQQSDL
jgi:hemerythrin-like metal-binding protein